MAMSFSPNFSCANEISIFPYSPNTESYSLTESLIDDEQAVSYYQLPLDLGTSSAGSSIIQTSDLRPKPQTNASQADARFQDHLQLENIEAQRYQAALKGDLKGKPISEESAKKRKEQNRASQRAYRERRERRIEELEQRNRFLQRHASILLEENERLKLQLLQVEAEKNRLAKESTARSSVSPASSTMTALSSTGKQQDKEFLDVQETWSLIQDHWLYKCGHVRVEDVYQRLKEEAEAISLDGIQKRADVIKAIQSCSTGRHYDLL